jgi:ATP-dependent Clp protease adapter protein ClpS
MSARYPLAANPAVADPAVLEDATTEERVDTPWRVILYDDDVHTFDEVIVQLVKATGCSEQQAERHAWTVHTEGKDCVYTGDFVACFQVQGVLREIQLVTEIEG